MYLYVHMHMHMYMYMQMQMYLYMYMYVYVYVYVSVYVYVCMYVCMCVCVCVCVRHTVRTRVGFQVKARMEKFVRYWINDDNDINLNLQLRFPPQMADLVTQPVLFNPSEQNGYLVSRVDINASNAITSSGDAASSPTHNSYMKRPREEALLDNNGNILEPSATPPLAKRPCFMRNRETQQEQGKNDDIV